MVLLITSLVLAAPDDQPCPCSRWRSFEETLAEHTAVAGTLGAITERNGVQRVEVDARAFLLGAEVPLPLTVWGDDPLGCRGSFPRGLEGQDAWVLLANEGLTWGLPRCSVGAIPAPRGGDLERLQERLDLYARGRDGELAWNIDRYLEGRANQRVLSDIAGRDDDVGRDFWVLLLARRGVAPQDADVVARELARTATVDQLAELAWELSRPAFTDHDQAAVVVAALEIEGSDRAVELLTALAYDTRLHGDVRVRAFQAVAAPDTHRHLERVLVTGDGILRPQVLDWLEQAPQPALLDTFLGTALGWTAQHEAIAHGYARLDPGALQQAARAAADGQRPLQGQLVPMVAGQVLAAEGAIDRGLALFRASLDSAFDDETVRNQTIWELGVLAARSGLNDDARRAFEKLERLGDAPLCPPGEVPGTCRAPLPAHAAARPYALDQRSGFTMSYSLGGARGCALVVHPQVASGPDRKWMLQAPRPGAPKSTLRFELVRPDGSFVAPDDTLVRMLPALWLPNHELDFDPAVFDTSCDQLDETLLVRATLSMRGPSSEWGDVVVERWVR